jgi:hypothetical protein
VFGSIETTFDWSQLDEEFAYAKEIGLTIIPMLAHMSYDWESGWMRGPERRARTRKQSVTRAIFQVHQALHRAISRTPHGGHHPDRGVGGEALNRFVEEFGSRIAKAIMPQRSGCSSTWSTPSMPEPPSLARSGFLSLRAKPSV